MLTIRDVMETRPIAVRPESPLRQALELLIEHNISGLPVVDDGDVIVGVLTEKDVLKIFYEDGVHTVASVMTQNPTMIAVDAPLVDVVDCLMANDFRRVLIHHERQLVGLISRADLMPAILESLLARA